MDGKKQMNELPDKKYNIIYADPPWKYDFIRSKSRSLDNHYNQMSIEDIKNMPVNSIAEDNSILCLWVTFPKLQEGLDVMKSWGFNYTTLLFNWVKKNKSGGNFIGMGYYTRSNAEICILGKKGKGCKAINHSISNIVESAWTKHSEKPKFIRDKIVELFGDISRIELFAREKVEGWDSWGNEV
jgi:N6-adenosine-specific RNA methylase IME4